MKNNELLPCPVCPPLKTKTGKQPKEHHFGFEGKFPFVGRYDADYSSSDFWVQCPTCGIQKGSSCNGYKTEKEAIEAWNKLNTRPQAVDVEGLKVTLKEPEEDLEDVDTDLKEYLHNLGFNNALEYINSQYTISAKETASQETCKENGDLFNGLTAEDLCAEFAERNDGGDYPFEGEEYDINLVTFAFDWLINYLNETNSESLSSNTHPPQADKDAPKKTLLERMEETTKKLGDGQEHIRKQIRKPASYKLRLEQHLKSLENDK